MTSRTRTPAAWTSLRVVGFSGNLHRPSRSRGLVDHLLARIGEESGAQLRGLDLLDTGLPLDARETSPLSPSATAQVTDAIAGADALVVSSPVYKGSYTGLFKHVIDLLHPDALRGKPVLLTATGGGHRHALVTEHQLRPLFGFFEAATVATSLYACEADFTDGRPSNPDLLARAEVAVGQFVEALQHRQNGESSLGRRLPIVSGVA